MLDISATQVAKGLSNWSVMVFPALLVARMLLIDTTSAVLTLGAYNWAFVKPVCKLYYNLTIIAVSVVVAMLIGCIEALGLFEVHFELTGRLWDGIARLNDNFNTLGFLIIGVIVAA